MGPDAHAEAYSNGGSQCLPVSCTYELRSERYNLHWRLYFEEDSGNTARNKRKYENKKRNKRMRRKYDEALAAEMSDVDADDSIIGSDFNITYGGGPPPSTDCAGHVS